MTIAKEIIRTASMSFWNNQVEWNAVKNILPSGH